MNILHRLSFSLATALLATSAHASVSTINFDDVTPGAEVRNFYNGGTDSAGASGDDFGISFYFAGYAASDKAHGGLDFLNEPSAPAAFGETEETYVNVAFGFTDGFSLYYSSSQATVIFIFDDVDLKGNLIAGFNIGAQYRDGCQASDADFCNWSTAGTTFAGTAKSVYFGSSPNHTLFDNMTFGSATPMGPGGGGGVAPAGVPEPAAWSLMLLGFGSAGVLLRRRRFSPASRPALARG